MEFQTYAAAGRLSEIVGEGALNYDRTERRRGMGYGADQSVAHMEKHDKEVFWHCSRLCRWGQCLYQSIAARKIIRGVQARAFRLRARGMDQEKQLYS